MRQECTCECAAQLLLQEHFLHWFVMLRMVALNLNYAKAYFVKRAGIY